VFLIGGPSFSGTTLLTLLLDRQEGLVCLDEPDFHDPEQTHRGIPVLRNRFRDRTFPDPPAAPISEAEATELVAECDRALRPLELGIKTCDWTLVRYVHAFRERGCPVVLIFRDPRDILARPLPHWQDESVVNAHCRAVWALAGDADAVVRYEDLVAAPQAVLDEIGEALGRRLVALHEWREEDVSHHMLKNERHELLRNGSISAERVGLWRSSARPFSDETLETAALLGYEAA
jgi:hypothetical protein